jgi:hypothetical protein
MLQVFEQLFTQNRISPEEKEKKNKALKLGREIKEISKKLKKEKYSIIKSKIDIFSVFIFIF